MTEERTTPLRERLIEDMRIRGLGDKARCWNSCAITGARRGRGAGFSPASRKPIRSRRGSSAAPSPPPRAGARAGIAKPATLHTLRHCLPPIFWKPTPMCGTRAATGAAATVAPRCAAIGSRSLFDPPTVFLCPFDVQGPMCPDIMSWGFSGAESGAVRVGDAVAVFAQGPIGLCATAGARLIGATTIIAVESVPTRMEMARRMGADHVVDFTVSDPTAEIMRLTDGRGVDVAIEALGRQETFEGALRVLRPGGTLSSLGVYSGDLRIPLDGFLAGLGDHTIRTTLCPGGKERMRRLMEVIASGRVDTRSLVTHRFKLDQIEEAYDLFANQRDGVLKVAITP